MSGPWSFPESGAEYTRPEDAHQPVGVALSSTRLRNGRMSARVQPRNPGEDAGRLLLGYNTVTGGYYSAGLGGYGRAYVIDEHVPGLGWRAVAHEGRVSQLGGSTEYDVHVDVRGQGPRLLVDGISVPTSATSVRTAAISVRCSARDSAISVRREPVVAAGGPVWQRSCRTYSATGPGASPPPVWQRSRGTSSRPASGRRRRRRRRLRKRPGPWYRARGPGSGRQLPEQRVNPGFRAPGGFRRRRQRLGADRSRGGFVPARPRDSLGGRFG